MALIMRTMNEVSCLPYTPVNERDAKENFSASSMECPNAMYALSWHESKWSPHLSWADIKKSSWRRPSTRCLAKTLCDPHFFVQGRENFSPKCFHVICRTNIGRNLVQVRVGDALAWTWREVAYMDNTGSYFKKISLFEFKTDVVVDDTMKLTQTNWPLSLSFVRWSSDMRNLLATMEDIRITWLCGMMYLSLGVVSSMLWANTD